MRWDRRTQSVVTVGVEPRRVSALALALGLDALSVLLFVCSFTLVHARRADGTPNETFFSDPVQAALMLTAATIAIAAGAVAAVGLAHARLHSRAGRWATRLALVNAMVTPVVGLSVTAGAWLVGYDPPEGWGQPIAPFWLAVGLAAAVLGVVAKEPGQRGVLGAFERTGFVERISKRSLSRSRIFSIGVPAQSPAKAAISFSGVRDGDGRCFTSAPRGWTTPVSSTSSNGTATARRGPGVGRGVAATQPSVSSRRLAICESATAATSAPP